MRGLEIAICEIFLLLSILCLSVSRVRFVQQDVNSDLLALGVCRCYGFHTTFGGCSFPFTSHFQIVGVSFVLVMHVGVVLSVIVQMHVFTASLFLRHEGLVSDPPNHGSLAIAEPSKEPRPLTKSGGRRNMVKMVVLHLHCLCVGIWVYVYYFKGFQILC